MWLWLFDLLVTETQLEHKRTYNRFPYLKERNCPVKEMWIQPPSTTQCNYKIKITKGNFRSSGEGVITLDHNIPLVKWRYRWSACTKAEVPIQRGPAPIMLYKVIGPMVRDYLCDYVTLEDWGHRNGLVRKGETQSSVANMGILCCCANSNLRSQLSAMLSKWRNKCLSRTTQIYLLTDV